MLPILLEGMSLHTLIDLTGLIATSLAFERADSRCASGGGAAPGISSTEASKLLTHQTKVSCNA